MQHQFRMTDVHEYMDFLSEGMAGKPSYQGWEQRLELPEQVGKGFISRMLIRPGMEVLVEDLTLHENMKLYIDQDCQVLGLAYQLSGDVYCEWNGAAATTSGSPGNTVYFTDQTQVYLETSAESKSYGVKVRLRPGELSAYFAGSEEHERFAMILSRYKNTIGSYRLTPAIEKIVFDILVCEHKGPLKRLFMESKALELIMLFIQEQEGNKASGAAAGIQSRNDLEKLHLARQTIIHHLEKPLSILELSQSVGLSTTKLKKGFRELFGLTVFDLVREQRMLKGAWLLESNQMKVCEAAVAVGYSNPSNFTAAFRKQYGCNPSEFLQQSKLKKQ
ncbi:hypothetical protein A8L34_03370 [Bacillus sp. FJAT-27264]|uniref:helix-turn-helix domain-containing protein n=1 Tax=Paenibacillus sp. (strain DSM 101736 / FJAT-27264) TaxID=1850362 RepID=UPI000807F175|nr:AraC family transcriptional regulator [Bacillus sp. FJAT-27264]OBZ18622.1 hypothetical protein A8L34_03370 [Bacillus sp. FJAT-27264]